MSAQFIFLKEIISYMKVSLDWVGKNKKKILPQI
jgi:hypothetical protein